MLLKLGKVLKTDDNNYARINAIRGTTIDGEYITLYSLKLIGPSPEGDDEWARLIEDGWFDYESLLLYFNTEVDEIEKLLYEK